LGGRSPLLELTEAQARAIEAALPEVEARCFIAMRYWHPFSRAAVQAVKAWNPDRVLLLPLYPQYAAATTASALDAVADVIKRLRWPPELRIVNDYHDDAGHIEALARSIERWWATHGRGDRLLLSFHGIPQRYVDAGDPYFHQCHATARGLRARLGLEESQLTVSFQSRVGREAWLRPYTDETVRRLAGEGIRRLDVACPGFAVDCLETLEEIAMQNAGFFTAAGGQALRYIPALNDSDEQVASLAALLRRHAQGWPEFLPGDTP
jgi:ferrochelatase